MSRLTSVTFCLAISFAQAQTPTVDRKVTQLASPFAASSDLITDGAYSRGTLMVTADFNRDGKPDLAIVKGAIVYVYLGKGDGTFQPAKTTNVSSANLVLIQTADFNGDGKPDLVVGNGTFNAPLLVLLGVGDGSFSSPISQAGPSLGINIIAAGDFNKDGKPDLAMMSLGFDPCCTVYVMYGAGNGTLAAPKPVYTAPIGFNALAAADLNGDGRTDIVTELFTLISQPDGTFAMKPHPVSISSYRILVGDLNGDGKPDLAIPGNPRTGSGTSTGINILLNRGDGSFSYLGVFDPIGSTNRSDAVSFHDILADFNGDGKLDYVGYVGFSFLNVIPSINVCLGNGDGTFQRSFGYTIPTDGALKVTTAVAADFDGDGKTDLVELSDSTIEVLLNRGSGPNQPVAAGALNGASFATGSPLPVGGIASIFGTNLAAGTVLATTVPLPLSLGGVSVTVNGIAAPLYFVSLTQINIQIPWNALGIAGTAAVVVTTATGVSPPLSIPLAATAPAFFTTQSGKGQAIAINADGTLAVPVGSIPGLTTHPAQPGDALILYANGVGPVSPSIASGVDSSDTLRTAVTPPVVLIGGVAAQVLFAGLSPQFAGVNQLNVIVPASVAAGDSLPIQMQLGGTTTTNTVTIAVSAR